MKFPIIIVILFFAISLSSQDYFVKNVNLDDRTNSGKIIIQHDQRFFILDCHFCDNLECSSLAELSINGDTIWATKIPDIDVARGSMIVYGDTITITGNNEPLNTKFRMAHFNLDGEKISETIEIEHPTEKFINMFQLTSVKFRDNILVTGVGLQNSIEYGLIYAVDHTGLLDTLIMLEPQDKESIMWEVKVDKDGYLYTYHDIDEGGFDDMRKKINKFDKDFNLIWTYQSEDSRDWRGGSTGAILEDGRALLVTYSPIINSPHSSIRAINEDGSIEWQYNVPFSPFVDDGTREVISRMKQLPSGDILCMGRYTNLLLDEPIRDSPYMYTLSTEGELIWKRVFYELDPDTENSRIGFVRDAIELDNSDLYGIGVMKYEGQNETFIFKVDSEGCLGPDNCDLVQLITDVKEVETNSYEVSIYPNPTKDIIHYNLPDDINIREVTILDVNGKLLTQKKDQNQNGQFDLSSYASGIYLIKFVSVEGDVVIERFVKG